MATHSNIIAWKIPWTDEPGELFKTIAKEFPHLHQHVCICSHGCIAFLPVLSVHDTLCSKFHLFLSFITQAKTVFPSLLPMSHQSAKYL